MLCYFNLKGWIRICIPVLSLSMHHYGDQKFFLFGGTSDLCGIAMVTLCPA